MTEQQLHEIAMLALSKTEFKAVNNPVDLAKEMLQHYNNTMAALTELNQGPANTCVIDTFGTPTGACAVK